MNVTRAIQRAVSGFIHGNKAMAAAMNPSIEPRTLNNKTNPNYDGAHCSPEEVVQIMRISGDHGPLIAMADELSSDGDLFVVLKVPRAGMTATHDECTEALLASVKNFSDFASTSAHARSPDSPAGTDITENEQDAIEALGVKAIVAIQEVMKRTRAKSQSRMPPHLRAA